jgi:hydroxymethylbilane synthase
VITIGTRGSRLALAQTEEVKKLLEEHHPGLEVAVKVIRTRGDRGVKGGKGLFVKELEEALLAGEIDLAIHSAKDLPVDLPAGLILGAVPKRLDPLDALISRGGLKLEKLPRGARVGTGSPRRRALLLHLRPDLEVVDLRGNLDTRLKKLGRGDCDAIVVALCGLMRLGWQGLVTQILEPEVFLPAVGQGALAIEIRDDDEGIRQLVEPLNHAPSWAEVMAERSFLRAMGGGCRLPIAALGRAEGDWLKLEGLVVSPDGRKVVKEAVWGRPIEAEELGRELAERLVRRGLT